MVLGRGESLRVGFTEGEGVRELSVDDGVMDRADGARGKAENRLKLVSALNGFPLEDLCSSTLVGFAGTFGGSAIDDERDIVFPCPETEPDPLDEEPLSAS